MQTKWIWYPGEFEAYHHSRISLLRTERNATCPPIWKMDGWYTSVTFSRTVTLSAPETVRMAAEGGAYVEVDGRALPGPTDTFTLPAGQHTLAVRVGCLQAPPALWMEGESFGTDVQWLADNHAGPGALPVGCWTLDDPDVLPSQFRLPTERWQPAEHWTTPGGEIYDFGRETMGYVGFTPQADGPMTLYYGESVEEVTSDAHCEVYETLTAQAGVAVRMPVARALRYARFAGVSVEDVCLDYEYLPVEERGSFTCDNEELNRIYEVAYHTMHLNTREFFLDGIKRDRWVWGGDALQSIMMNHYTFFDRDVTRRTLRALRGKDPFQRHINTIMDYTFYWLIGIWEDYLYTGDDSFLREMYPKMVSMVDFCLGRRNPDGFMEGREDDWVFIDWCEGMPVTGELCAEQLLLARALEIQGKTARLLGDPRAEAYEELAVQTREKTLEAFWDEQKGTLCHHRLDGALQELVERHPLMFALQFGYLPEDVRDRAAQNTLMNDEVPKITTPYMRFYELDAMGRLGLGKEVVEEMLAYWGGMVRLGATSFWETFDPEEPEHLSMYGRPYGRSLCHCWGASPLYLTGRYLLGVRPTEPGYARYEVKPMLGTLGRMAGTVPTPCGDIRIEMDRHTLKVTGCGGEGLVLAPKADGPCAVTLPPYGTVEINLD